MKRRKWDSKAKAKIVLEGLKGKPISQICNQNQIGQAQYYQWREQFLSNLDQIFDLPKKGKKQERLEQENRDLKAIIGDLTIELKKSEEDWL